MAGNINKLLTTLVLSVMITGAVTLGAQADSLSFSDFSEDVQNALENTPAVYGDENGSSQRYYEFQYDTSGNIVTYEVTVRTPGAYTITYNYDNVSNTHMANTVEKDVISGNFIDVSAISEVAWELSGGAITNNVTKTNGVVRINNIEGNFIGNHASRSSGAVSGGAIYNYASSSGSTAEISNITGDFVGNYLQCSGDAPGGAIFNSSGESNSVAKIGVVTGDFINNYINISGLSRGGAIANFAGIGDSIIETLNSNFIGNYAISTAGEARGGAISNTTSSANSYAKIDKITGDFINNYVNAATTASGGAIFNAQLSSNSTTTNEINNIEGNFTGNYVISKNDQARGGAIANLANNGPAIIKSIEGNFTDNYAKATSNSAQGGAIYNSSAGKAIITSITGDFIGNYVETGNMASGGAIYNAETSGRGTQEIDSITGNFINNYASGGTVAYGGAIVNKGIIGELKNILFTGNYAKATSGTAHGGAIFTTTSMKFTADAGETRFSGNYTESAGKKEENAIYVSSTSAAITLNAVNNGQVTFDDRINGQRYGLIMTGDTSGIITLNNLVENAAASLDTTTLKLGVTDSANKKSDVFKNSTLEAVSGVVDTTDGSYVNYNIKNLTSSKDARYSIDLSLSAEEQLADTFTVGKGSTGTIYLSSVNVNNTAGDNEKYIVQIIKAQDDSIQLDYDESKVLQWATAKMTSDIVLAKDFGLYTTKTTNDSLVIRGQLDSLAEWAELDTNEDKVFTFVDSSERTLTRDITELKGENITIQGTNNTINIDNHKFLDLISDAQNVSISDVILENSNDITNNGTLTLDSVTLVNADVTNNSNLNISGNSEIIGDVLNEAILTITDAPKIEGVLTNNSSVNITEADITFENEINGAGDINVEKNSKVVLNNAVQNQTITVNNSDITLANADTFIDNSLYMNGGNFNVPNLGMSNLVLDTLSLAGGNININSVDVDLANETMGRITANTYQDVSGKINVNNLNLISSTEKQSTDILFVDKELAGVVSYNGAQQVAYSPVYKYDVSYKSEDNGGYFNFARSGQGKNAGDFNPSVMASPVATQIGGFLTQSETLQQSFYHMDRYTKYTSAQHLAAEKNNHYAITDGGTYNRSPLSETSKGIWYNPYTSFETVNLKGGIGVSNVTYGTLIGGDTDLYDLGHGYKGVISTFIGYNGSHQSYNGTSIYQNGGTLGITGTMYKNNFFTGLTASTGASTGSADTMYGTDNFTMLTAGIASKTGYNWEIHEGKLIVQSSLYLGYTFVNTFDYTNAAGVKIDSEPLHALQIIPGVTFIGNLQSGWQPYASVNMVFNAMDKTHFTANDVRLPQLSVKPYVQYGVGIQKTWGEKLTGFLQTMFRNGGRNGIALSLGFRWSFGKSLSKTKSVSTDKKIIKQLRSPFKLSNHQ